MGFPCSSVGKESSCSAGDLSAIPGLGRSPGEGNGNSLQYFCLENSMNRGGYRPWGRKELDTIKRLIHTVMVIEEVVVGMGCVCVCV